jgi:hypothetical protein
VYCAAAILILLLAPFPAAAADNTLATARDLYAAAAYEDALNHPQPAERRSARTGRGASDSAVPRVLPPGAWPQCRRRTGHRGGGRRSSPGSSRRGRCVARVRTTFAEVRRRSADRHPAAVRDCQVFVRSEELRGGLRAFQLRLEVMNDPDLRAAAAQPPLADCGPWPRDSAILP